MDTSLCVTAITLQLYVINRNRNLQTSKAPLKSLAKSSSLFTSAASNQRGCPKDSLWEAQVLLSSLDIVLIFPAHYSHVYTQTVTQDSSPTFDAGVAGLQVASVVAQTGERIVRKAVDDGRDPDVAGPLTRAPDVELVADADLTLGSGDHFQTAATPHSTVEGRLHEDDLVGAGTSRAERLSLAVLVNCSI